MSQPVRGRRLLALVAFAFIVGAGSVALTAQEEIAGVCTGARDGTAAASARCAWTSRIRFSRTGTAAACGSNSARTVSPSREG